jgi:hypothetical protein
LRLLREFLDSILKNGFPQKFRLQFNPLKKLELMELETLLGRGLALPEFREVP